MKRRWVLAVLTGAAAACGSALVPLAGTTNAVAVIAASGGTAATSLPGGLLEISGADALGTGRNSAVESVSCASAGDCAAGGNYLDRHGDRQGFVASERNGAWGKAIEVPGLGALNLNGYADVVSVSCSSPGNCAAGGNYYDKHGRQQGFVASERNGVWRNAIEAPGRGILNLGAYAGVESASCAAPGNCAAGGFYRDNRRGRQGFVVSERNGVWGKTIEVPGLGALNAGEKADVISVSCASAGNCVAGGNFTNRAGGEQGFVAGERNGEWHKAVRIPGLGGLSTGGTAQVKSVSCATPGNCTAGGQYRDVFGGYQGFVATEQKGVWRRAFEVPGLGALNSGETAEVAWVSCAAPGNCAVSGDYRDRSGQEQGFVASERNGTWRRATSVPGLGLFNGGGNAEVESVSCASPGNCAASGYYTDRQHHQQGFVVSERNGAWHRPLREPASKSADARSVSCGSPGYCVAAGTYLTNRKNGHQQGFAVSEQNGTWRKAFAMP